MLANKDKHIYNMKDTHQRHTYSTSIELKLYFHTEYKEEHKKGKTTRKITITTAYTNSQQIIQGIHTDDAKRPSTSASISATT